MEKSFSDSEISRYIPNVYAYEELKELTPEEVLRRLPLAILYQETPTKGHWTVLLKTPEGIEFFDPYGIPIDLEFKDLKWQQPRYLADLLYKLSKIEQINYNQYKFQSAKEGINTCGRWIIMRSLYPNWTINQFAKAVENLANKLNITSDQLAVDFFTE
jgi:hypothetical protein